MKTEHLSFPEAVRELAAEAGIDIPDTSNDDPAAQVRARQRERLFEILEAAATWFGRNLEESREAQQARWYSAERALGEKIQKEFQLGFAPRDGAALARVAEKKGFTQEELIAAGLLVKNDRGVYTRFRGRLMFPIKDASARVVGFGGRILGDGEPKYLNSPETLLFNKSDLLFALPQAKARLLKEKRALVVEGYMDAIACHQAGVNYAVATLGTALTAAHAKQLKRYAETIYLVFDNDKAGLAAAQRGSEMLLDVGFDVRIVQLGKFKDPDEFLKANGAKAFEDLLPEALEAPAFFLEAALKNAVVSSGVSGEQDLPLRAKVAAMQALFPLLAKYDTDMEVGSRLRGAAERLKLASDEVLKDYLNFRKGKKSRVLENKIHTEEAYKAGPLESIEKEIIGLLAVNKEIRQQMIESDQRLRFHDSDRQCAVDLLWKYPEKGPVEIEIQNEQSEHFVRGIRQIKIAFASGSDYPDPQKALKDLLEHKEAVEGKLRAAELQREISQLKDKPEEQVIAMRELIEIRKKVDIFERAKKSAHAIQE